MQVTNMRMIFVFVCGLLLAGPLTLNAAEETTPAVPAPDVSEEQTAEEMLAAEAALEAQQTQAETTAEPESESTSPLDAGGDETITRTPGSTDQDFVPTIQISEDLSVSFPVDI